MLYGWLGELSTCSPKVVSEVRRIGHAHLIGGIRFMFAGDNLYIGAMILLFRVSKF